MDYRGWYQSPFTLHVRLMTFSIFIALKEICKSSRIFPFSDGRTGVPYVDANMREMAATGFMSNRGRQVRFCF